MKNINIRFATGCTQAEDKFNNAMRAFIERLKFPATLRFTNEGAVIVVATNEKRRIQTEIRAKKIAARWMKYGEPTAADRNELCVKLAKAREAASSALDKMIELKKQLGATEKQAETEVYAFCKGFCNK